MLIPIRCFSCGKVVAKKKYIKDLNKLKRYCCKRMILTNVQIYETLE
jgi:DNA-directed RNA polymerase subunit N (RpoN/RPB10)